MQEITLNFDNNAIKSLNELMKFYNSKSKAEVISKGIALLKLAAYIEKTDGKLIAKKGHKETVIIT
jgi:hypothetical protein